MRSRPAFAALISALTLMEPSRAAEVKRLGAFEMRGGWARATPLSAGTADA
jgi:hypothetical protein